MNSNLSVAIPIQQVHSVEGNVADIRERISKRAYDKFLNRGAAPGNELEDWLSAEAELIIRSSADLRFENNQVVIEVVVPNVDPTMLFVNITPDEMLVLSGPDQNGMRVFQTVRFQQEIVPTGMEAEYVVDTLFVIAPISDNGASSREAMKVA